MKPFGQTRSRNRLRPPYLIPATPLSPLPYHTANSKTVPAVTVILREDSRRVRTQVVTVGSRASSSRPPEAIRDAYVDEAIRAIVEARTEKVEATCGILVIIFKLIFTIFVIFMLK